MDRNIRNEIMMNHEYIIKAIIKRNQSLIKALRLERDDVYQELVIAMFNAIDGYNSDLSDSITTHIWVKLQYAVLDLKKRYRQCGMTGNKRGQVIFVSIESYRYDNDIEETLEIPDFDDNYDEVEIRDMLAVLTREELKILQQRMKGFQQRRRIDKETLASAQEKIREILYAIR